MDVCVTFPLPSGGLENTIVVNGDITNESTEGKLINEIIIIIIIIIIVKLQISEVNELPDFRDEPANYEK